jgi:hypothetical protein
LTPLFNIDAAGQRQRRAAGIVAAVVTVGVLLLLEMSGANRWWRLAAFPLFWASALGFMQARAQT